MDHADPPPAGSLEPLHDSLAGTDAGLGEKYTMNAHRTSTEMGWGRGTAPFPRPHPQKQNAAVYTKVWTHLVRVLLQSAIAYFHESELQLHHLKHVLHPRPHLGLCPVFSPRHFIHDLALVATASLGEIPRSWRALADHAGLPLIRSVAPHPRFFPMQQVRQHRPALTVTNLEIVSNSCN